MCEIINGLHHLGMKVLDDCRTSEDWKKKPAVERRDENGDGKINGLDWFLSEGSTADVNGDGVVDCEDVDSLEAKVIGTPVNIIGGDVNLDGDVNIEDFLFLNGVLGEDCDKKEEGDDKNDGIVVGGPDEGQAQPAAP